MTSETPHEREHRARYEKLGWKTQRIDAQQIGSGDAWLKSPDTKGQRWEFKDVQSTNPQAIKNRILQANRKAYNARQIGARLPDGLSIDVTRGGHNMKAARSALDQYLLDCVKYGHRPTLEQVNFWALNNKRQPDLLKVSPSELMQRMNRLGIGVKAVQAAALPPPRASGIAPTIRTATPPRKASSPNPQRSTPKVRPATLPQPKAQPPRLPQPHVRNSPAPRPSAGPRPRP